MHFLFTNQAAKHNIQSDSHFMQFDPLRSDTKHSKSQKCI